MLIVEAYEAKIQALENRLQEAEEANEETIEKTEGCSQYL
ncbi:MAG: hypothetical protein ACI9N9_000689 [Enterobacterales bacterium]